MQALLLFQTLHIASKQLMEYILQLNKDRIFYNKG